jgi:hypothetical protein
VSNTWTWRPDNCTWKSRLLLNRYCVTCERDNDHYAVVSEQCATLLCAGCCQPGPGRAWGAYWPNARCRHCAFPLLVHAPASTPRPRDWYPAICTECGLSHDLPVSSSGSNRNAMDVFEDIEVASYERDAAKIGEPGWVYVMLDVVTTQVKVGGTSRSPEERWAEHPRGLVPLFTQRCFDWRACERTAHERLAKHRVSREEWFNTTPDIAIKAVIYAAKHYFRPYNRAEVPAKKGAAA